MRPLTDLGKTQPTHRLSGPLARRTTLLSSSADSGLWDDPRPRPTPFAPPKPILASSTRHRVAARDPWGWLPALSLIGALGLLTIGAANRLSGSGVQGTEPLFWLGLLMIVVPIAARLLASRAERIERLGLVVVLGLQLYLVKVLQSPFGFTYSDEFIHFYNASQIADTARLFAENPVLRVSALYPGLEAATVGLVQLAGLDIFSAGLVVVGLARLVMMLALFLLYEQISGSARTASLAVLIYTGHSNFMFWSAQYSYESLALPLVILALYAVARREGGVSPRERVGWTLVAIVLLGAVVVTHHLSSYFAGAVLVLWALISPLNLGLARLWMTRPTRSDLALLQAKAGSAAGSPGGLALFAAVAAIFWLVFIASLTLNYLPPMFGKAMVSLVGQITGDEMGRGLFHSATGGVTPMWERVVGLSAVLVCLLGLPFGLWQVWRRHRYHPLALMTMGAAVAYFGLLGLRFVPSAWEISNRSSEFLFLGLAFVLASARMPRWLGRPILTAAIALVIAGGVVAGWSPGLRVARVYQVTVEGQTLEPAGMTTARWVQAYLGPGHKFAADDANGRYLLVYGNQTGITGRNSDIKSIFESPALTDWQIALLRSAGIEYVAVDRRLVSADNMLGYFFDQGSHWPLPARQLLPPENYQKFDHLPGVSRFFDSGDIALYDIRTWINAQP